MKDDSGAITLLVLLGLALVGVVLWKKGIFSKIGTFLTPAPPRGTPPPQGMPIGPTELGAAAPGGGSAFGRVCNYAYQKAGEIAQKSPDPRAQVAGVASQALGPMACAAQEYVAGKVWDGTKWVGSNAGKGIATGAKGVASGAKSAWNATIGKLF